MSLQYTVKKFRRSKRVRILIRPDGSVLVTAPYRAPLSIVHLCVQSKEAWIEAKRTEMATVHVSHQRKTLTIREEYKKSKHAAQQHMTERVAALNSFYGFTYNKVSVRNQSTRWGSCSHKGNLTFHFKVAQLPPHLADYIVVHELCHLKEMNHSSRFWSEVARTIPNHKKLRAELRSFSL